MTDTEFKALIEGIEVHLGNGTPSDSLGNDLDLFVDRDGRKFWRKCNGKWTDNALYVLGPLFLSLVPPVGVSPDVARTIVYRNGNIEWSEDISPLDGLVDTVTAKADAAAASEANSYTHALDAVSSAQYAANSATNAATSAAEAASSVASTVKYPNYSAGISILAAYNANAHSYTVGANGWILARADVSQVLRINAGDVIPLNDSNASRLCPVKAGDVLTGTGTTGTMIHLNFFPERG